MHPLLFQKHLWLPATLCQMLSARFDATTSGYPVGYGTAAQFTHEYKRLFSTPPLRNIKQLWETVTADAVGF